MESVLPDFEIELVRGDSYRVRFPSKGWRTIISADRLAEECVKFGVKTQEGAQILLVGLARQVVQDLERPVMA